VNGRTASGIVYYWRGVALVLVIAVVCFCLLSHTLLLERTLPAEHSKNAQTGARRGESTYNAAPQYPVC